jgi:hypothetical protein
LCQRLIEIHDARPRAARRPTPQWSSAYDTLLAETLRHVEADASAPVTRTILRSLVAIGLDPGLLRWRGIDLGPIYRALSASPREDSPDASSLRACVNLAVTLRDFPSVHFCANQALHRGQDSTWHLLRLAWLHSVRDESAESRQLVLHAINTAREGESHHELMRHLGPTLDRQGIPSASHAPMVSRIENGLATDFSDPEASALRADLANWLAEWMDASEFWGGAFYGCPYFITTGGLGTTNCDRARLPPARTNATQSAAMRLPIAEFWDPTSGEEMVAISGLPVGPGRTGSRGVLRFWSTISTLDGHFTEIPLPQLRVSAAGRVVIAQAPRNVRAWFLDAGELPSGESRLAGVDDADFGRGRTECISDLFLVSSDDPEMGLGVGWAGMVPFTDVLRRHQPAVLGVQYRSESAGVSIAGRVTISALDGQQGDVSMPVQGEMAGTIGEISVGLDISRLRPGRYRATIAAAVPGCGGEQRSFRDFRVAG